MQVGNGNKAERYHNLDAVRAGALLLGVFAHATISFFPEPSWVADDAHTAPALLVLFFSQHIFRMSLFFVVAGFFAHLLLERRGIKGFVRNRLKRIGLVFLVFWPLMLLCLIGVAFWAANYAGTGPFAGTGPLADTPPAPTPSLPAPPRQPIWRILPLGHTWFLYFLMLLYAGALALVGLFRALDASGRLASALDSALRMLARIHLLPLALAAPLAFVFLVQEPWTLTSGIRNPDFGLLPAPSAFVGFGTAFTFGWFVHRQPVLLQVWQRTWLPYSVVALALTAYCANLMGDITREPALVPYGQGPQLLIAATYPLALWAWIMALLGAATRFLAAENKLVRYLADASYWVYLLHLPLVVALQVLVSPWALAWPLKYVLIIAVATPLLLGSYQLFVRYTALGGWLNGQRYDKEGKT